MTAPRIALIIALGGCLAPAAATASQTTAYVLTSDFSSGSLSTVALSGRAVTRDVATVYSDARIRWYDGLLYVVNRFGQDNIQVIDPAQNFATIRQFSVGNGSNPQDINVVSPTKAYVTRLGSPRLLIVNPSTGDSLGAISLAGFADADGNPDMDRMIRVGQRLFVSLERLSGFLSTDTSLVAVVDVGADTIVDADPGTPGVQAIVLPGTNPVTPFAYDAAGGRLLIGCVGRYQALDGGVARVNPITLAADGFAITEAALGGDVLDIVWRDAGRSFAIVSDASFNTSLVAWSPTSGQLLGTLFSPGGFSLADVALDDRDELYVCDNDVANPGVFVFKAATGAPLAGPLDTGLPPKEIAFDAVADPASVGETPGHAFDLAAAWPQPARGAARARLTLAVPGDVQAEILDVAGRRVRSLASGPRGAGRHELSWDGLDAAGRRVTPGVYMLAVHAGGDVACRRVVMLR